MTDVKLDCMGVVSRQKQSIHKKMLSSNSIFTSTDLSLSELCCHRSLPAQHYVYQQHEHI